MATVLTRPPGHLASIERVVTTLREPAERALNLNDMADIAGLSPFHFSRIFRGAIGIPPGEFNAALRLDHAKRLLLETDQSVTDICFEVGYESLGAFTTRFTRLVGVSPGQFRRLPELTAPAFASIANGQWQPTPLPPERVAVSGRLATPASPAGLTFIGLFNNGIASGRPIAGTMLRGAGTFQIADVPDGRYQLLAASLAVPDPRPACLITADESLVGSVGPVTIRNGHCATPIDLRLRKLRPLDPPVIIALPVLLCEALQIFL